MKRIFIKLYIFVILFTSCQIVWAEENNINEFDRSRGVEEVLFSLKHKEIGSTEARQELYVLLSPRLDEYLRELNSKIKLLQEELNWLNELKNNPKHLIQHKVYEVLGPEYSPCCGEELWW